MINLDRTSVKRITRKDLISQHFDKSFEVSRFYVPVDDERQIESIIDVFVANKKGEVKNE